MHNTLSHRVIRYPAVADTWFASSWMLLSNVLQFGNPVVVPPATVNIGASVSAITRGMDHSCALLTNGSVKCCGVDPSVLGYGSKYAISSSAPTSNLLFTGGTVASIVAGFAHTCIALTTGALRCWGNNWAGQLGYGDKTRRYTPAQDVPNLGPVASMSLGCHVTCAVLMNGDLYCWGQNDYGKCFHKVFLSCKCMLRICCVILRSGVVPYNFTTSLRPVSSIVQYPLCIGVGITHTGRGYCMIDETGLMYRYAIKSFIHFYMFVAFRVEPK